MFSVGPAELDAWLAAFFYPFFRILALMSSAPILSHAVVPRRIRIALAIGVTIVVAPSLPTVPFISPFTLPGMLLLAQQALIGVAVGIAVQLVFAAVELAGEVIGLQMGLSFATFIDPNSSDQQPLVGSLLNVTLILVFLALDGHLTLIAAIVDTFRAFPPDGSFHAPDFARLVMAGKDVFVTALGVALPVIAAMLVTNLGLGVLTRTAPQLNLFAVGFPLTLAAGLAMLLFAMPFFMPSLTGALTRALQLSVR